ncbi:hypothetical protein PHMEG_00016301 [Phytophthora megakarya]|uniref:Uncharacterized protein n=1 Tax=Phytophthora megakarya TaxID=4795 RepID=A0A225VZM7_9STRA|nr:hypothetical protein PHMEG_00016301 [Phytophthora megakarya]
MAGHNQIVRASKKQNSISMNTGGVCTYGLSQPGYLFERSQNALRQRQFSRARGMSAPLKRSRDRDSDSDEETLRYRRPVLEGFKRMKVASPKSDVDSDMTDEEAATPRHTWRTDKAIIPKAAAVGTKRELIFPTEAPWKSMQQFADLPLELNDANCRAMVVFDPRQSIVSPAPRVELVEDDKLSETDTSESEEEHFVRFEELSPDNDEPVDMDID